jgi:hypothetical protein
MLGRTTLLLYFVILFFVGFFFSVVPQTHAQASSAVVIATVQIIPPEPPIPTLGQLIPIYKTDLLGITNRSEVVTDDKPCILQNELQFYRNIFDINNLEIACINASSP